MELKVLPSPPYAQRSETADGETTKPGRVLSHICTSEAFDSRALTRGPEKRAPPTCG